MANKAKFSSKIGLIAATVGSSVGLGNIWRFPAEVQSNGGAAFLLIYIICVALLGIPVMLAEFSLGRAGQTDTVSVFSRLAPKKKWWIAGALALLASYMILSFYMVVAGWTFSYLWESITGNLFAGINYDSTSGLETGFTHKMEQYICSNTEPLINTYIMILANIGVLLLGVRKGIERMSNILMPLLFLLLLIFAGVSLTLPGAEAGVSYFLTPDFSKITPSVVVSALGQAFFSLSLGMGILITYAAYYPRDTRLLQTSVTVASLDMVVAVMMGLVIFPAVASFGLDQAALRGTTLVFVTLPEVFVQLPGTQVWAILFFTLLLVAALTSTISIAEVSISFIEDKFHRSRFVACMIVLLPLFVFSGICTLSFGMLSDWKIAGLGVFDFLDTVSTNIMLPVVSILVCLFIGWFAPKGLFRHELTNGGTLQGRLYPAVSFIVRYIAPLLILAILLSWIFKT